MSQAPSVFFAHVMHDDFLDTEAAVAEADRLANHVAVDQQNAALQGLETDVFGLRNVYDGALPESLCCEAAFSRLHRPRDPAENVRARPCQPMDGARRYRRRQDRSTEPARRMVLAGGMSRCTTSA
jgi:hypothetical protein